MNSVKIGSNPRSYHHGNLRRKLIEMAEELIGEYGVDGFTLRETARRAGVSPAAPAHHFRDARGLLTAIAQIGFEDFATALKAADARGGADPARRLAEQARAYVRFALDHPARFQLMFREGKHDAGQSEVAGEAFGALESAVRAATGGSPDTPLTSEQRGMLTALWSSVHGFAHLAFSGQLGPQTTEDLLDQALPPVVAYLLAPRGKA